MSASSSSAKPKQQRLRASCDGCFLAKVKCSKSRPICSRCLTCGTDCRYSPSSRNGKPRADAARMSQSSAGTASEISPHEDLAPSMLTYPPQAPQMALDGTEQVFFGLDTTWSSSASLTDDQARTSSTSSNTSPLSTAQTSSDGMINSINDDCFDPSMLWNAAGRHSDTPFGGDAPLIMPRSKSMNEGPQAPSLMPWIEGHGHGQGQQEHSALRRGAMLGHNVPLHSTDCSSIMEGPSKQHLGNCNCFTTCLQALQALHNYSGACQTMPAFDVVLTVNRRAVQGCAMMLNCGRCLAKSDPTTTAMLLATIISKVMSFYRAASQNYFGVTLGPILQTHSVPLTFGTYQINGEESRWLEMEILLRELRRLEELFSRFQEICGRGFAETESDKGSDGDDMGVHNALTNYLGQSLRFTFEVLKLHETPFMT